MFDAFHVVLVEPEESRNVGAVARAMRNLGFRHLHLVAPVGYDPEQAAVTARAAARPILDTLTIHERLDDALAERENVVGFALPKARFRDGNTPSHYVTLPQWASNLEKRSSESVALVFGPEADDLRREHLERCRWVVRIPSTAELPSFNLAQSVLLALYEVSRALGESAVVVAEPAEPPTWNEFRQLDRLLDSVMERSGFSRPGTPVGVPGMIRNLFRRTTLNRHEMRLLMSLFGRVDTSLAREEKE